MATIAAIPAPTARHGVVDWGGIVRAVQTWAESQGVDLSRCVLLLPFAQHLGLARQAWVQLGGWMPRIETTQTLARSLAPAPLWQVGQISFETATDGLQAAQLLRATTWGKAWWQRDARGFEGAVAAVVQTAHALARAAATHPPAQREAYWQGARTLLSPQSSPASAPDALERHLAWVALQWAALGPDPATDVLFAHSPSAWIVVQAGGPDALPLALMGCASVPCAVMCCDPDPHALTALPQGGALSLAVCDGFEHEAQCAAAQVLLHVAQAALPVALVAQDRVLVRRVRALLAQTGLALHDETGWKLSTTRAAAQLMSLLQAALPQASTDALVDWLKACVAPWPGLGWVDDAVSALEAACRRAGWCRLTQIDAAHLSAPVQRLWLAASRVLSAWHAVPHQSLAGWRTVLEDALQACGIASALEADEAGGQVLAALHGGGALAHALSFDEFVAWVDAVLEESAFVPAAPDQPPQVVITPLARLMLRPFAAVVLPGADNRHLGATTALLPLLNNAQAAALGLPTQAERLHAERVALAHALRVPHVTALYRRLDGDEHQTCSPLIDAVRHAAMRQGVVMPTWVDPRIERRIAPALRPRPSPRIPGRLPQQLSASACEALRACPYRFFALYVLKLREADELDGDLERRDLGTWLHAVLYTFHRERLAPVAVALDVARLQALGEAERLAQGWADADYLPMAAWLAALAPGYVAWLHAREAAGAQWLQGEYDCRVQPEALGGVALQGRIDRIDLLLCDSASSLELIDYKTGGATALNEKVREPLEDTQLAFYAALVQANADPAMPSHPLQAHYLVLGGTGKKVEPVPHPSVAESAAALIDGLGQDLARLRSGAALPALGEGRVCDFCEVRGLCRKDEWA